MELPWSSYLLVTISVLILQTTIRQATAQCDYISVSGSYYSTSSETDLNGQYDLIYGLFCNGMFIWFEVDSAYMLNYIFYLDAYTVNNNTLTNGWVIGRSDCSNANLFAKQTGGSYYSYPYNVPYGNWQEYDPSSNTWVNNPSLNVYCNSSLSTGAIIGIVFGCICGFFLIIALLACCCHYCKMKHLRETADAANAAQNNNVEMATAVAAGYATAYPNVAYNPGQVGPYPAGVDPYYASIYPGGSVLQPPVYDNTPPPQYYSVPKTDDNV